MLRRADDMLSGPLPRIRPNELAVAPSSRRWQLPAPHLCAVLLITAFGCALRFCRLTFPVLWNDETLVYWRVCGTYGQMLVPLHLDGFPPLHYSLYWLLGHPVPVGPYASRSILGCLVAAVLTAATGVIAAVAVRRRAWWVRWGLPLEVAALAGAILLQVIARHGATHFWPGAWVPAERAVKLTPWVMRSVPAVCGTLTIPAMYFLARQLLPRGASLVAALLTACSAFMLFYSRDAKMYPDAWLLITLNIGCLLLWFRTGSTTAYLAWVAAGCGMVGLHPSALVVPAVPVVYLFTQRRLHWARALLFLLGTVVIYAGPIGYYTKFNVWTERVETYGWSTSGLGWVGGFFNGDRTGPEYVLYTASSFLSGYEWPRDDYLGQIVQPLQDVPQTVFLAIIAVLAVAVLPWPLARAVFRPQRQAARDAAAPEPPWRVWLWLGTWIIVPAYGFYCRSVDGFVSPLRWVWETGHATNVVEWAAVLAAVETLAFAAVFYRPMRAMLGRLVTFCLATVALFGLCWVVYEVAYPAAMNAWFNDRSWGESESIWTPRYLGFIWPAIGVGVAALLMRLPTRPVRIAAITFFCLVNLAIAEMRMALWTEPPIDRLVADVWAAQGPAATTRTYDNIGNGGIEVAGTYLAVGNPKVAGGRYYLEMLSERPMSPSLFERSLSWQVPHPYALREGVPLAAVRHDVRTSPQLTHVVIWSQLFKGQRLAFDPYRKALPPPWRLADEQVYPVRVVWDWREKWRWVRREYVRAGSE